MKDYVDQVCEDCAANGVAIAMARISVPRGYRDGAVVAPLHYEDDEFCGLWFVQFGLAVNQRFMICRLDLGQARFRFSGANDVQYPEAIRENEAKVKCLLRQSLREWRAGARPEVRHLILPLVGVSEDQTVP
jgi:hypothetical protein